MTRAVVYELSAGADRGTAVSVATAALGRGEIVWARVHGIGCLLADAFSAQGVSAALHARTRGRGAGLPILVRDSSVVHALFADFGADAAALMAAHWPGPLTLLGSPTPSLQWDIGAAGTLSAVAVTMPDTDLVQEIVSAVGPCVYLQAHPNAQVLESATTAHARMSDAVAVYIQTDSEAVEVALSADTPRLPTTIVDVRRTPAVLVRSGALSAAVLRATCPGLIESDTGSAEQ